MSVKYLDPRPRMLQDAGDYSLKLDADRDGMQIALVSNFFPDADTFVGILGDEMQQRLPRVALSDYPTGDLSHELSAEALDDLYGNCHAAVLAYGH
jgi:hypothetical protein